MFRIHHPELRLKEGLREIANLLEQNRTSDARDKVKLLWNDCFSPNRPLLGDRIGRYNRDWSRKAKRDVEKIMGKDGSKMTATTVAFAREWIMNHFAVSPGRYGITKDMKAHLGDFAEWLEEFDHSSCSLELPGQYTARKFCTAFCLEAAPHICLTRDVIFYLFQTGLHQIHLLMFES